MIVSAIDPASLSETTRLSSLLQDWREDTVNFLRHDAPKLVLIAVGAFVLVWMLRLVTRRMAKIQAKKLLPGLRGQQVRTLASVINSVGVVVILFWAILQGLPLLGLNLGPLLASAGVAGLAIGFGAQTLVHDVINGFFILMEDQFNLGDTIRIAGVKGTVEGMSLRRTLLRDDDGTVHMVPNSQVTIVSNMTRDWAQIPLRVTVAYNEDSNRVVGLLQQVAEDLRHDPHFADDIVADIQVPGIDRIGNGEAEYLMLVKTHPNRQYAVGRELRRRIKESFQKNNIQPGAPGRVFVADQGTGPQAA
jgi:small conductance mechanosensitive channel